MNRLARLVAAGMALASMLVTASAQDRYPSQSIRFVVPFAAGSATDTFARLLGHRMSGPLGQNIVVENIAGGSGVIAAQNVVRSAPDGHTVFVTSNTTHASNQSLLKKVPYDAIADFEPVTKLGTITLALVAHPSVPANDVKGLIAYAKANPGKLSFGFAQGTASQLVGERFKVLNGLDIVSVPYKGGALAVPDILGGRIQMYLPTPATGLPLIRDGKLRALAITSATRSPALPDVPTMAEVGLGELTLDFWAGILAPAGTPPDVVTMLNAVINEHLKSAEMTAAMSKLGFEAKIGSPQDFAAFIAAELPRWAAIVKSSGVKGN
jgi:tripartite-type tricarboxylate transporter receptor subunit TctC